MHEDLGYASVFELQAADLSAVEVVDALLARIEALDGAIRSVLAVSPTARDDAATARPGPLRGIPVLVKDNVEALGLPATAGATSLAGRAPTRDAPLVARLRAAGAIILGATNLSEWANIRSPRSTSGWSAVGGLTANPWDTERSAGGSSSGSGAALAAGFAPVAIGTETDGSITCPCSLTGVAGIKPTVGAVPTAGVVPISASQDSPGPMARTVDEVALLLEVLAGRSGILDRVRRGIAGVRVGVARAWRTGHPATDALFDACVPRLEEAGASVRDVTVPVPSARDHQDELTVLLSELGDGLDAYLPTRGPGGPQTLADVVAHEEAHADIELAYFGHEFFQRALEFGGRDTHGYRAARARNLAWAVDTCLGPAMDDVDVLIAPSFSPAAKNDLLLGGPVALESPVTMAPAIAGWPIATAPIGLVGGLPVGLAAVGRPGAEADLLAVCRVVEKPGRPALPRSH